MDRPRTMSHGRVDRGCAVDALPDGGGKLFTYFGQTDRSVPHPGGGVRHLTTVPARGLRTRPWRCTRRRPDVRLAQTGSSAGERRLLFGGENVRSYPVEIRSGVVRWMLPTRRMRLCGAAVCQPARGHGRDRRRAHQRRTRCVCSAIGTALPEIVRAGVQYTAPRGEYGWDHSLADARRLPALAALFPGPSARCRSSKALAGPVSRGAPAAAFPAGPGWIRLRRTGLSRKRCEYFPLLVDEERVERPRDSSAACCRGRLSRAAAHALLSAITDHFLSYATP